MYFTVVDTEEDDNRRLSLEEGMQKQGYVQRQVTCYLATICQARVHVIWAALRPLPSPSGNFPRLPPSTGVSISPSRAIDSAEALQIKSGVGGRHHHPTPNHRSVRSSTSAFQRHREPLYPQTLVKWPGRVTGTSEKMSDRKGRGVLTRAQGSPLVVCKLHK